MNKKYNKQKELTQFLTADDFTSHLWAEVKSNSNTENLMYMLFLKALSNPRVVKVLEEVCKETGGIIVTDATDRENQIRSITKKHFDTIIKEVSVILDEYNELALRMNCEEKLEAEKVEVNEGSDDDTFMLEDMTNTKSELRNNPDKLLELLSEKIHNRTKNLVSYDKSVAKIVEAKGFNNFVTEAIKTANSTDITKCFSELFKYTPDYADINEELDQVVEKIVMDYIKTFNDINNTAEITSKTYVDNEEMTSSNMSNKVMSILLARNKAFC